ALRGSDALALQRGRSLTKLTHDSGARTRAGEYYEAKTGEPLPEAGFMSQQPVRTGNVEKIKLRDGSMKMTRRYDEAAADWIFTKLGLRYYRTQRRNYVASVPVIVEGKRKDGSRYTFRSHMPLSRVGFGPAEIRLDVSDQGRRRRVRERFEEQLREQFPDGVVQEHSDEVWILDPDGSWKIHEEVVA
ncbi:MAG: hypothetical protein GY697_09545, partial [Desulfobacterales bacterium]|nr:hypothetical protein [Desulfobacterales bacterium]